MDEGCVRQNGGERWSVQYREDTKIFQPDRGRLCGESVRLSFLLPFRYFPRALYPLQNDLAMNTLIQVISPNRMNIAYR